MSEPAIEPREDSAEIGETTTAGALDSPAAEPGAPAVLPSGESPEDVEAEEEAEAGGSPDDGAEAHLAPEQLALAEAVEACRAESLLPPPRTLLELVYGEPPDGLQWCTSCRGGAIVPTALSPHPGTETCSTCRGLGEVATGSNVLVHSKAVCPACKGHGYTGEAETSEPVFAFEVESPLVTSPLVPVGE